MERWRNTQDKEDLGPSAQAEAMPENVRLDTGPQDVIPASDSGDSERDPLAIRDDGKTQLDDEV